MQRFLIGFVVLLSACQAAPEATKTAVIAPIEMKAKTFASLPEEKPAPVVAAKPPVIPEVNILVGKSAGEIRRIFGEPALLRQEAPAEVWQYLSLNCALHLFFYPPEGAAKGSELRVSHISVNGRDMSSKTPADPKKCFASELLQAGPDGKPAAS